MRKIILLMLAALLFSCGNEPPIIKNPLYTILVYQKDSLMMANDQVFLSIYFELYDENGEEDIHQIKITHISEEISWIIGEEQFNKVIWGNSTYYGYSFLEYESAQKVLLGEYLIEVTDKGGNMSNQIFEVEIEESTEPVFSLTSIDYEVKKINQKELKIIGADFDSCEIKFINHPELFNHSRKKFRNNSKMIFNFLKEDQTYNEISVRINRSDQYDFVYFLKNKKF